MHVVSEGAGYDGVVHHRLVGLVLEIAIPARTELMTAPAVHLLEFFLRRADLDAGLDAIGGEGSAASDIPFLEDLLLDFRIP